LLAEPILVGEHALVSSDDFCPCCKDEPTTETSLSTSPSLGPICKEHTEFSLKELSMLLDDAPPAGEVAVETQSSDDFLQPASTFASFYHRNCMASTGERVVKRTRRVYHNRRKTAWTDYDEDGRVIEPEASSAEKAEAASAEHAEAAEEPALVKILRAEALPGLPPVSRERIKEAALAEAAEKSVAVAKVLEATGPCGWTPLLIAVQRRQMAATAMLLELGAKVECMEPCCGWTPLMYAAQAGKKELVQMLLDKGASVNACSVRHKWSPLCSAIQSGNEEVVHQLLAAGADLQAVRKQHPAIADIYRQGMA